MDTAMRDLERIRERDPEHKGIRRVAVIVLAALATVALVFSVAVIIGGDGEEAKKPEDPLMALDRASGLAPRGDGGTSAEETSVDEQSLAFPSQLVGKDAGTNGPSTPTDRPEMAAALAAAEAELAHPDPIPTDTTARGAGGTTEAGGGREDRSDAIPAAEARGDDGELLARTVARDPLDSAKQQKGEPSDDLARPGRPGDYTLQVISYRSPEEARAFAKGLRARDHRAFVTSADIPKRGRYWRVRIGPFDSKREAQDYREQFESEERMNTYVVKQDDEDA